MLFLVIRCKNYAKTVFRHTCNTDTVSMLRPKEGFFAIFFILFHLFMDKAYEITQDPNLHVTYKKINLNVLIFLIIQANTSHFMQCVPTW